MLVLHIIFSLAILVFVVICQWKTLCNVKKSLMEYDEVSKTDVSELQYKKNQIQRTVTQNDDSNEEQVKIGEGIFGEIISGINAYLEKNASAIADFQLIKDIVNRKLEAKEEEISTQLPFPLYYGLAGTMGGVIVSLIFLMIDMGGEMSVKNISPLLIGVAIAMLGSVVGLVITTWLSNRYKETQCNVALKRDEFLNWIQTELLPKVGTGVTDSLVKMSNNLADFNNTFSGNTQQLNTILGNVRNSYREQTDLMKEINKLNLNQLATANADIYDKLKNCTNEIGQLGEYLKGLEQYIKRLDDNAVTQQQNNSALSETLNAWNQEIQERKGVLNRIMGDIDSTLQSTTNQFRVDLQAQYAQLLTSMGDLQTRLQDAINEQQEQLAAAIIQQNNKLQETLQNIPTEIKQLVEQMKQIPSSVADMTAAAKKQNEKLDDLISAITKFNETQGKKIDSLFKNVENANGNPNGARPFSISRKAKIALWVLGSLLAIVCVVKLITYCDWVIQQIISLIK